MGRGLPQKSDQKSLQKSQQSSYIRLICLKIICWTNVTDVICMNTKVNINVFHFLGQEVKDLGPSHHTCLLDLQMHRLLCFCTTTTSSPGESSKKNSLWSRGFFLSENWQILEKKKKHVFPDSVLLYAIWSALYHDCWRISSSGRLQLTNDFLTTPAFHTSIHHNCRWKDKGNTIWAEEISCRHTQAKHTWTI